MVRITQAFSVIGKLVLIDACCLNHRQSGRFATAEATFGVSGDQRIGAQHRFGELVDLFGCLEILFVTPVAFELAIIRLVSATNQRTSLIDPA